MKTLQISDEVYQQLLAFVIDPFEDTADAVIARLCNVASKAKDRWSHLAARQRDRCLDPVDIPPEIQEVLA
ncbi:MAG: hypothetical protein JSU70_16860 [Phycisphaerales bacterium]|nr:MAG: hypothetical protein JSU70_16860 [Phycisphaerales bacterium]